MILSDTAVRHRTTVFVLTGLLVLAGLYSYAVLPREAAPEVVIPNVFVTTRYRGVSPADMETSITREIEEKLKGLKDVKTITSVSSEGLSQINVEFVTGTDIDKAVQRVKDKVDLAESELPSDLDDDPIVEEVNISELPILVVALAGEMGLSQLRDMAEDLEEDIEGVPGVLEVDVVGGLQREIQIQVSPMRMAQYNVSFAALQNVVRAENTNVSGGSIRTSEGRYQLRLEGEFDTVKQAEEIVIQTNPDGSPVYLRDVADVVDGFKDLYAKSRLDGRDAVILYVEKRAGENIPRIVSDIDEVLRRASETWPPGTRTTRLVDHSEEIHMLVSDLENNIITGLLLVILVVCLVMGLRNAILVSLSIPLSMLLGFTLLRAYGFSLNMVVLFSLTLALGMLVDNGIVIIENIYRFMQQGVDRTEAAMRATGEVAFPVIGSALTTIAAFTPLLWWSGIMGDFMFYLPATVITLLASCLFVALVINPAVASAVMRVRPEGPARSADEVMSGTEHPMLTGGGPIIRTYRFVLRGVLGHHVPVPAQEPTRGRRAACHLLRFLPRMGLLLFAVACFAVCVLFWVYRVGVRTPTEFFPAIDPERVNVELDMPEGADLPYCDGVVKEVEKRLFEEDYGPRDTLAYGEARKAKSHRSRLDRTYASPSDLANVESVYARVDALGQGGGTFFGQGQPNRVTANFVDIEHRTESSQQTTKRVADRVQEVVGAKVTVEAPQQGPPTGAPIVVEITGHDLDTLGRVAEQAVELVEGVPFVRNVRDDFEQGSPTLQVRVDRKRAALLGLNTQLIGFALRAAINGVEVGTFRDEGEDYDIRVQFQEEDRRRLDTLRRLLLPSPTHGLVPLTTVAQIEYAGGVEAINRKDHGRVVTVRADVDETKTTGPTARKEAEAVLAGTPLFGPEQLLAEGKKLKDFRAARPPDKVAELLRTHAPSTDGGDGLKAALRDGFASIARCLTGQSVLDKDPEAQERARLADRLNHYIRALAPVPNRELYRELLQGPNAPARLDPQRLDALFDQAGQDEGTRHRLNRLFLEAAYPQVLAPASTGLELPPGYHYHFAGELLHEREAVGFLRWAGAAAVGLIFLILVSQFNSVVFPFIILSSVALSLGGVFLGLGVCDLPFVIVMSGVGVISLAGVVVNNAIVLVDYTLLLRKRGMAREDAIVAAGATRLRPVVLTALTTMLGLVPMATGYSMDFHPLLEGHAPILQTQSESSQWWQSMAVAVIFGLAVATMLTLVAVPVLFSLLDDLQSCLWRLFQAVAGGLARGYRAVHDAYWRFFWRRTGLPRDPEDNDRRPPPDG